MLRHGLPTAAGPQGTPPLQGGTIRFLTMAANPVILHPSPNSLHERLGRFERRDGVRRNDHRRILRDIAGYFLRSLFDDKTAETAQINILSAGHRLLHTFHERFHDVENNRFSQSPLFGNLGNDISFCEVSALSSPPNNNCAPRRRNCFKNSIAKGRNRTTPCKRKTIRLISLQIICSFKRVSRRNPPINLNNRHLHRS